VANRISQASASDWDLARRYARIGGNYGIGTAAWRTIAKPILALAKRIGEDKRRSLFSALTGDEIRTYSGTPGEVPTIFTSAVESARKRLEEEKNKDFIPFWEWHLKVVEAELHEQEEQAKEELGE